MFGSAEEAHQGLEGGEGAPCAGPHRATHDWAGPQFDRGKLGAWQGLGPELAVPESQKSNVADPAINNLQFNSPPLRLLLHIHRPSPH
jgi:hypothetical protein